MYYLEEPSEELKNKIWPVVDDRKESFFPERYNVFHTVKYLLISSRYLQGCFSNIYLITYF